jgi:hypothetical protein
LCKAAEEHGTGCGEMDSWHAWSQYIVTAQMDCMMRMSDGKGWGSAPPVVKPGNTCTPCAVQTKESTHPRLHWRHASLISGTFPSTISELMHRALNILQSWHRDKKPSVNPDKKYICSSYRTSWTGS